VDATRTTWNDDRMDEFAKRIETTFRELRAEIRELRTELHRVDKGTLRETGDRNRLRKR
jgi:hypothetical protein